MIYKVQFKVFMRGCRKLTLEGLYLPESGMSAPDMKRDVTAFMRRELETRDEKFKRFEIELTIFKRLKTDFLYNPRGKKEEEAASTDAASE